MLLAVLLLRGTSSAAPAEHCTTAPSVNATRLDARYTFAAAPAPLLVPFPRSLLPAAPPTYVTLSGLSAIALAGSPAEQALLRPAGLVLAGELKAATGGAVDLAVVAAPILPPWTPQITLSLDGALGGGGEDVYRLSVDGSSGAVAVSAGTFAGVSAGTGTLLQAVSLGADHDATPETPQNCSTAPAWRLPAMQVADGEAALPYRGIMVDAARAYLPLPALKSFVQLCRLHKLNYLHLHLSDDGSFTFPSAAFPELAARAPFAYNASELAELQRYAAARGVALVGEVDVPGHASGLTAALPGTFGFASLGDKQVGIVDFTSDAVVAALQTIFDEIGAAFPTSPYVHMGGDEVNLGKVQATPEVQAAMMAKNVTSAAELYRLFLGRMDSYAKARNKTLLVWEGFQPPPPPPAAPHRVPVSTDIIVQPFDCNIYTPPRLAADGYKIINSAWTPLYIAAHHHTGPHHPFPPALVYAWNPWLFGTVAHALEWFQLPAAQAASVVGAQMCVWQLSAADHLCMLSSRAPAMAERLWNPHAGRTFEDYSARVAATSRLLHTLLSDQGLLPPQSPSPTPPPPPGPDANAQPGCLLGCSCT